MANRRSYHFICSIQLAIYIISVVSAAPQGSSSEPEIKLVTVIFRHGDRTPDDNGRELYPNDPYLNYTFPPMGLGQLTNEGKQREYELGNFLRKRYDDFLGATYVPTHLAAHSTDYVRTKMSLQLVLAALYPPTGSQIWHEYLNWQPIPFTYTEAVNDDLMIPEDCPLYLEEYNRIMKIPEVVQEINVFQNFMKNLTALTGKNITTPEDMYYLYHTLMAEWSMNLTLPYWTNPIFPDGKLWDGTILNYKLSNYNTLLRRLNGGKLLKRVTDEMLNRANNVDTENPKIYLFSGHETNVAALLQTLGVFEPHVPQYSSAVIIELLQDDQNNYFVKVINYLGIPPKANVLSLPGCEELCPFERFLNITYRVIPTDEELNCDKTLTPAYSKPVSTSATSKTSYNLINTYREHGNAN